MSVALSERSQRLARMIAEVIEAQWPEDAASAPEPLAYSVAEALQILRIGRSLFYAEVAAGRLKVSHVGRRTLVRHEALRQYLAEREGSPIQS